MNAFPLLVLAGSTERRLIGKGAFQEMDALTLLSPLCKAAIRPSGAGSIGQAIRTAYQAACHGRPGSAFADLPADLIQGRSSYSAGLLEADVLLPRPPPAIDYAKLVKITEVIKSAKSPLIVIGKGAAYADAANEIRALVNKTGIAFLPTPMGKGVVPDSHRQNASSARSAALKYADVVLLLGARLNWILHFGEAPKWNAAARFIQIDIDSSEIGKNKGDAELSIVADLKTAVAQLAEAFHGWEYDPASSAYTQTLAESKERNEKRAALAAADQSMPLKYAHAFAVIKDALHSLSPPEDGNIVYVSEGANTMDISRSVFPLEHPRLRLDAGTNATMGVGLGYAIAAYQAYNNGAASDIYDSPSGNDSGERLKKKKVVAIEGDSAFGFSGMEIETMARYRMDILVFVINNGGVYHGDADTADDWAWKQGITVDGPRRHGKQDGHAGADGLRSTSLGWEVRYEKIAEMCGGRGFFVRTAEELRNATIEGFKASVPVVVNVIIESGKAGSLVSACVHPSREPLIKSPTSP